MVGLLSRIGRTEKGDSHPDKKISMYKIFIDFDTNGGNGSDYIIPIFEVLNLLHNKAPHRKAIMKKVYEYLKE